MRTTGLDRRVGRWAWVRDEGEVDKWMDGGLISRQMNRWRDDTEEVWRMKRWLHEWIL